MAKINNLKEIRGTIDDLVFYTLNGVQVVRRKSGFNSDAFTNNPNYKKVRENSSEFGHCSKVSKMIRMVLSAYVENCGDKLMYQKFTKVMTNIKNLDNTSEQGKRRVEIGLQNNEAIHLLKKFQFGEIANLEKKTFIEFGLFNEILQIQQNCDEAIFLKIDMDFENYTATIKETILDCKGKQHSIDLENTTDNSLNFLVLKKKKEIINMGFI